MGRGALLTSISSALQCPPESLASSSGSASVPPSSGQPDSVGCWATRSVGIILCGEGGCALSRWGEQVPFIRASSCSLHTAGPRPGCLRARPCQQELGHSAPSSAPAEQAPGLEPPCGPSEAGHDFPPMPRGGLGGGGSHLGTSSWRDGTRRPWPLASPEHMGQGCSCSQAAGLGQEDTPAGPGLWAEDAGLETSSRGQRLCWLHKVHGNSKQKQNPNPEVPQSVRSSQKPLPQLTPPAAAVREPGSSSRRGPGLTQKETRGSS